MTILIVDDDSMIRNWLTMLLAQIQGYSIEVLSANDGELALECCRNTSVDLVITDITMPRTDGLQLIKSLREEFPYMKVAVLSAYDNYQYIRTALKYGALDYILKSEMKLEDLIALLEKVNMASEFSSPVFELSDELIHQFRTSNKAFQSFVRSGTAAPNDFLSSQGLPTAGSYAIYAFYIQAQPESDFKLFRLQNLANRTLAGEMLKGESFYYRNGIFIVLYQTKNDISEDIKNEQMKYSLLLHQNTVTYCNQKIESSVFQLNRKPALFHKNIEECLSILELRRYYAKAKCAPPFYHIPENESKQFISQFQKKLDLYRSWQDALADLTAALAVWHEKMAVPTDIKATLNQIFLHIFTNLSCGPNGIDRYFSTVKCQEYLGRINEAATQKEVEEIVKDFAQCLQRIYENSHSPVAPAIQSAVDYIEQHYNERITLDDVAAHIYLNKTYVSQLFKKQLGIRFQDYLENVRIAKAKNLLRSTTKSISQISDEVGYASQSYFTKVFKKTVGMSPLRYREVKHGNLKNS